jgi:3-dehydroquinate synthetase
MHLPFQTDRHARTDYIVSSDLLAEPAVTGWGNRDAAIIFDSTLEQHHPRLLEDFCRIVSPKAILGVKGGEALKNIDSVIRTLGFLAEIGLSKKGLIIGVGGGTVCDVVSFAANLFRRGLGLALVPTTLLAQIDAAVGGKNGVNFHGTKNLIGHFYHPEAVICDISFLQTLPGTEFVAGLAEAIKVFAVSDARLFRDNLCNRELSRSGFSMDSLSTLVADSIRMKLDLLAEDPFEKSSRRLLNYGHAFAHTFEEESNFALAHGEAVLVGMTVENAIAMELGLAGPEIDTLQELINGLFTEDCRRYWIRRDRLPSVLAKLKSARPHGLDLVCLRRVGDAEIVSEVDVDIIEAAWDRAHNILMSGHQSKELTSAFASDPLCTYSAPVP